MTTPRNHAVGIGIPSFSIEKNIEVSLIYMNIMLCQNEREDRISFLLVYHIDQYRIILMGPIMCITVHIVIDECNMVYECIEVCFMK